MAKMNVATKSVIVLVVISIVCVGLLAVLNDLLYVAPDMSAFSATYEGEYQQVQVKRIKIQKGKVEVATEGQTTDGKEVVGLYITANGVSPAGSFAIVVIIDKATHRILSSSEIVDGSTGDFSYDENGLNVFNDMEITSADVFNTTNEMLQSGATSSSKTVRNAFIIAANYYYAVYRGGLGE